MGNKALTQIDKLLSRPDPLLSFKWVSGNVPLGLPSEYLESIEVPFNNVKVGEGMHAGSGYQYYPGTHDVSGFSATFYVDGEGRAIEWILGWKSLIKNFSTGAYNVATVYKKSWKVDMLNTKNDVIVTAEFSGAWPSETSNFALNYSDTGRLILTQAFSVDDCVFTVTKNRER